MPIINFFFRVVLTLTFSTTLLATTKNDSLVLLFKKNRTMEQHVAHIYAEKPHLQHYLHQPLQNSSEISILEKLQKYTNFFSKYGIDFSMLLYCSYAIYTKHGEIYDENADLTKKSDLKNKILEYIPKNIINAPKHTCFFFDSIEIILKAFIVKTIVKLLIFFVEIG